MSLEYNRFRLNDYVSPAVLLGKVGESIGRSANATEESSCRSMDLGIGKRAPTTSANHSSLIKAGVKASQTYHGTLI